MSRSAVAKKPPVVKVAAKARKKRTDQEEVSVPLDIITIVPKPKDEANAKNLFWNARGEDGFTGEKMERIQNSLRVDGLLENLIGRPIYAERSKKLKSVELIAGERRTRAMRHIADNDLPCFDPNAVKPKSFKVGAAVFCHNQFGTVHATSDGGNKVAITFEERPGTPSVTKECPFADVYPTVPGSQFFKTVRVKLVPDCDDEKAVRLNWVENNNSEPLPVRDEIGLVERLVRMGKKQDEIAEMLVTNVTFVSQTASFREELPVKAFNKLIAGKMSRHMAVNILSYPKEERERYVDFMIEDEQETTAASVKKHTLAQERHEDEAVQLKDDAKDAEQIGDTATAEKLRRKAQSADAKAKREKARKEKAEADAGTLKQGHGRRAAAKAGIQPRKAKMLAKEQIEEFYIQKMTPYCSEDIADPVTGENVPSDLASIVRRTASAILNNQYDPLAIIREFMFDNDRWERPEDEEATSTKKRRGRPALDDEDEEDEDDEERDELDEEDEDEERDGPSDEDLDTLEDDDIYDREADFGGRDFDSDAHDREWN